MKARGALCEARLREWGELREQLAEQVGWPEINTVARLMDEGAGAGSPARTRDGPVPQIVSRFGARLDQLTRVSQVEAIVRGMPPSYRDCLLVEWCIGYGRPTACKALGWTEQQWRDARAGAMGWLEAKLT